MPRRNISFNIYCWHLFVDINHYSTVGMVAKHLYRLFREHQPPRIHFDASIEEDKDCSFPTALIWFHRS